MLIFKRQLATGPVVPERVFVLSHMLLLLLLAVVLIFCNCTSWKPKMIITIKDPVSVTDNRDQRNTRVGSDDPHDLGLTVWRWPKRPLYFDHDGCRGSTVVTVGIQDIALVPAITGWLDCSWGYQKAAGTVRSMLIMFDEIKALIIMWWVNWCWRSRNEIVMSDNKNIWTGHSKCFEHPIYVILFMGSVGNAMSLQLASMHCSQVSMVQLSGRVLRRWNWTCYKYQHGWFVDVVGRSSSSLRYSILKIDTSLSVSGVEQAAGRHPHWTQGCGCGRLRSLSMPLLLVTLSDRSSQ